MRLGNENFIEKFDGTDFHLWKFQMKMILCESGLLETVEPKLSNSPDDQKKQNIALAKISLGLAKNQLSLILTAKTGREAWEILERRYQ